ncbi:MAG: class I SAM-dependent methyltransferase [Crenarchaeota archaeon]|nr:class I SAM-dependent methyltransferase [Thermoproteota archaeon]
MESLCNYLWRLSGALYRTCETCMTGRYITSEEFWNNFAEEFIRRVMRDRDIWKFTEWQLSRIFVKKGDTVLDLGCGFGRLTIPLAERGCIVYAVDQCRKLLRYLEEEAEKKKLNDRIIIIEGKWEKLEPGKDIPRKVKTVIASHSIEVEDLVQALKLIIEVTERNAHIFDDYRRTMTIEYEDIMRTIFRDVIDLYPSAVAVIYLTLVQLGVYPNVETYVRRYRVKVRDIDEVIERRLGKFLPAHIEDVRKIIIERLEKCIIEREQDGIILLLNRPIGHIWWFNRQI